MKLALLLVLGAVVVGCGGESSQPRPFESGIYTARITARCSDQAREARDEVAYLAGCLDGAIIGLDIAKAALSETRGHPAGDNDTSGVTERTVDMQHCHHCGEPIPDVGDLIDVKP